MSTFNKEKVDHLSQPMFFGEELNTARYDSMKYPKFDDLIQQQLGYFWRPEEVSVSEDIHDFKNKLTPVEKRVFILNLQYQTLLDSVQGRSPNLALLPIVSLPELETWIETWSFSECLAEGTEVLTTDGWKDLGDTTTEDECLVYNLENDEVFFEKPKRVVEYDMDTDLVRYKSTNGKQFDQLVTPNHRMPVVHRDKRSDGTQKRYFKEAWEQDYLSHHLAPVSGYLKGSKEITDHERFLIALQADGSLSSRYTGERCGTIPSWFSFRKERKIKRLIMLCERLGYTLTELTVNKRDGQRRFKVDIPTSVALSKTFDWVDLGEVSSRWCEQFLEELSEWDSHKREFSFTYSSVVKSNTDKVQAIASLCGKHARLAVREDNRSDSYKDVYELNIVDRQFKDGQSIDKVYEKYKGKVRCLETSTGAFMIRYNGVVSVTGNTIHSRSYTYIIKNVFDNPSKILDEIMEIPEITRRAGMVTDAYDDLIDKMYDKSVPLYDKKLALFKAMVSVYALEAIRFYVSFACTFSFANRGVMEGNGKIMTFIARDEFLHQGATHYILTRWLKGLDDPEMTAIVKEHNYLFKDILTETYKQECEWADFLFCEGSIRGLNLETTKGFLGWITNERYKDLGLEGVIVENAPKDNPIPWIDSYLKSASKQIAPQEAELSSYMGGAIDNSDVDLDDFEL